MIPLEIGEVVFRGPIWSAVDGGFCILDEINMARNEALAVLHSVLDFRRTIHIWAAVGLVHPASFYYHCRLWLCRYGNWWEISPPVTDLQLLYHGMMTVTCGNFPELKSSSPDQYRSFSDIEKKCESGELTEKVLDLRGLLDALRLIQNGLSPYPALDMGLTNKTFDAYEQTLIREIITTRISKKTESTTIFS